MGLKAITAAVLSIATAGFSAGILAEGKLETPKDGTTISGKALFSGWHCDASLVEIELPSGTKLKAASGTQRGDTNAVCGDSDNGFGLLFNMSELGSGEHTVKAYADGVEFAESTFTVVAMSEGNFLTGKSATATISDFPSSGHTVTVAWEQTLQNFVITEEILPTAGAGGVLDDGEVNAQWNNGIGAFDEAIGYGTCFNDGGEGCPSLSWAVVDDEDRGPVFEVTYADADAGVAALFTEASPGLDMSAFASGTVNFDVKVINAGENTTGWIMKVDCVYPCTSGDQVIGTAGGSGWETVQVPVSQLVDGGLDLTKISTGLVIWPDPAANESFTYRIDNVYWSE
ncbi:MAG: putative glycoside hydrolase [Luminiphilus sp.]|nr:putative glycoside hydrolase [Luminiphilus sp.]